MRIASSLGTGALVQRHASRNPSAYLRASVAVRKRRDKPVRDSLHLIFLFSNQDDRDIASLCFADRVANSFSTIERGAAINYRKGWPFLGYEL